MWKVNNGQRPFVNYYAPIFLLYELSTPFLNLHWFFDKVHMTGTKAQLYNGLVLIGTFFACRLVWGSYQSFNAMSDIYKATREPAGTLWSKSPHYNATTIPSTDANTAAMRFAGEDAVPYWLAVAYLGSNTVLNTLNWYWFKAMIDAVTKRFTKAKEKMKTEVDRVGKGIGEERVKTEVIEGGGRVVEADQTEVRHRK